MCQKYHNHSQIDIYLQHSLQFMIQCQSLDAQTLVMVASLVAEPPNKNLPPGKLNQFMIQHFTSRELLKKTPMGLKKQMRSRISLYHLTCCLKVFFFFFSLYCFFLLIFWYNFISAHIEWFSGLLYKGWDLTHSPTFVLDLKCIR